MNRVLTRILRNLNLLLDVTVTDLSLSAFQSLTNPYQSRCTYKVTRTNLLSLPSTCSFTSLLVTLTTTVSSDEFFYFSTLQKSAVQSCRNTRNHENTRPGYSFDAPSIAAPSSHFVWTDGNMASPSSAHGAINQRPRKFAPLAPDESKQYNVPKLKGIVFDVDGTLW